jgi:hypothetical protein
MIVHAMLAATSNASLWALPMCASKDLCSKDGSTLTNVFAIARVIKHPWNASLNSAMAPSYSDAKCLKKASIAAFVGAE